MSTGGPLPWLEFDGVEIANAARTVAYIRNGLMDSASGRIELGDGELCAVLSRTAPGSSLSFVSPAVDPAPWYDPSEPGSTSFLGLVMLGLHGYDSTVTRGVTQRITGLGGGTFGGQHRTPRSWTFRAALVSTDDTGAEYGLRWLTGALESACDDCELASLRVRLVCPPANGSNDDLGLWTSYDVALTAGPTEVQQFAPSGASDTDFLGGCRDLVFVEWTMLAGNPFLYRPATDLGSVTAERDGGCFAVPPLEVVGDPITDAMREAGDEGDGLTVPAGYGFWPATTNYHLNGSAEIPFTGTDWLTANGTLGRTTALAKFGRYSGTFTAPGAVANEGFTLRADLAVADRFTTSLVQFSVWLRGAIGGEQLSLTPSIHHTDTTTRTGSTTNITLTTEWTRYTVTLAPTAAKTADRLLLFVGTRSGATLAFSCYADGVQFEKQAVIPTPYVDTRGTTATRALSAVDAPGGPDVLNETVGWVAFRVRMGFASTSTGLGNVYLFDWAQSIGEYIAIYYDTAAAAWKLDRHDLGTQIVSVADTFAAGDEKIIVATWNAGHVYLSINGAVFTSAVAATSPIIGDAPAVIGAKSDAGIPVAYTGLFSGEVLWYGSSSTKTLTNANAAEIAARAPYDPAPQGFTFDIGLPALETLTWPADDLTVATAVANGICDWLFGPPRQILCETVTAPERGTLGAIFTLTSENGFGGVVFQAWADCFDFSAAAPLEMGISGVPAGSTIVVDCARHVITITDEDGAVTDGQYLLALSDGRGLEWIEVRDCDDLACICVAVQPCATGTVTVDITTQAREG